MGDIQRPDDLSMSMNSLTNSIRRFNNEIEDLNDNLSLSKNVKSFDVSKYIKEYLEKEEQEKERIKKI